MKEYEGTNKDEAGKTQHSTQELGYDYNHAISEAVQLWNELKERHSARGWKYPPRDTAFEHLMRAWRGHPGKALVHLFDLPDFVHVKLSADGIELLRKEWRRLVAECGFRVAWKEHPGVYHTAGGRHLTISVDELRRIAPRLDDKIEECVVAIRPGANGKTLSTALPFRVDTEPFAELFGFYGDLMQKKAGHVTKYKEVHDEFVRTIEAALGPLETTTTPVKAYTRTYSTTTIQHLLGIGGLNTSIRQLLADNPAPLYLLTCSNNIIRAYLRSLFESEGGVSFQAKRKAPGSVDLHQAVIANNSERLSIPRHPEKVSYHQVGDPEYLLDTPPRLLTAASLLLLRFDISSRVCPASLYVNELDERVIRWRLMVSGSDIEVFRERINFISTFKRNRLTPTS